MEVSELLKSLVGVNFPVFIDDAERVPVIDNVRPTGQIFIAQVVKGARRAGVQRRPRAGRVRR